MIYKIIPLLFLGFLSFKISPSTTPENGVSKIALVTFNDFPITKFEAIYNNLNPNSFVLPKRESFLKALEGFYSLKEKGLIQKDILTIIDFSLSSVEKRLWVVDLTNNVILFQSLVAHGRNSGNEYAADFSNKKESHKSSLGFYATAETYFGKHGYSLRLDGLEKGVNNNARDRAIVIHGANYVSESFIEQNGRLGRSFGCPSLSNEISKEVIDVIKNKSLLYIYSEATKV